MDILFFGSEFDRQVWEVAKQLKKHFPALEFAKSEKVEDLLKIKDEVVIMNVVKNIEEPKELKIEDLKHAHISPAHNIDLGSFLHQMEKIGRLRDVKIISIPEQLDDSVISSIGKLVPDLNPQNKI